MSHTQVPRAIRWQPRGLSLKFGLPMAVCVLVIQLAAACFISQSQQAKLVQDLSLRGQGLAATIAAVSGDFIAGFDILALEHLVKQLAQQDGVQWAAFYNAEHQALSRSAEITEAATTVVFTQPIYARDTQIGSFRLGLSTLPMRRALAQLHLHLALATLCVLGLLLVVLTWLFKRNVVRPLSTMTEAAQRIAAGDLQQRIAHQTYDEIGTLAQAFNGMVVNLREMLTRTTAAVTTLHTASGDLSTMAERLVYSTSAMDERSIVTTTATRKMSENMTDVAVATDEAVTNIAMVATATEEMTSTINNIAQTAEQARLVTVEAMQSVTSAADQVQELGVAAQEISSVTNTIIDIAEQTKLLALNATIEAARAGEAGKGFAVVANEVKALATQTNEATENIRAKIEAIQHSSDGTVRTITQIREVITHVTECVSTIATAVEAQAITTRDMARNTVDAAVRLKQTTQEVHHAKSIAQGIAADMTTVTAASSELEAASAQLKDQAAALTTMAVDLQEIVSRFRL